MVGKRSDALVVRAVHAVPREVFLPPEHVGHADVDAPLSIGYAQTTSQPSLIAEMTRQLELTENSRVLEIGTGSGYQTAILAEIAAEVFTIERIPELAAAARTRLERLGYTKIRYRIGDGTLGWPEAAPFDGVIVTAAPPSIPPRLVAQLAVNGRMVIPVGASPDDQMLVLLTKDASNQVYEHDLFPVRFVPLISNAESWFGKPPPE